MNKKISGVLLLGLVLAFPAIADDQTPEPSTLMAGLSNWAPGTDGAMGPQWMQVGKQMVGGDTTRTGNTLSSDNFLSVLYKGFEFTPFINNGLYGINISYKW